MNEYTYPAVEHSTDYVRSMKGSRKRLSEHNDHCGLVILQLVGDGCASRTQGHLSPPIRGEWLAPIATALNAAVPSLGANASGLSSGGRKSLGQFAQTA